MLQKSQHMHFENKMWIKFASEDKLQVVQPRLLPSPHLENVVCGLTTLGRRPPVEREEHQSEDSPAVDARIKMRHLSRFLQRKFRKSFFLPFKYPEILFSYQDKNPIGNDGCKIVKSVKQHGLKIVCKLS